MPRISAFYGIVISMYFADHDPPHFHATYGEYRARISLESLEAMDRGLPTRALRLIEEWATLHQDELRANWEQARTRQPLRTIDPMP